MNEKKRSSRYEFQSFINAVYGTKKSFSWFKYIVKHILIKQDHQKLSSKGMELLANCIDWDVFNQYFPIKCQDIIMKLIDIHIG